MNDRNFDSLKSIKTPQAWLDKAAAIPETHHKKHAFPLYRFAAVASIVLVSVIGLVIFLTFGNGKAPVVIRGGTGSTDYGYSETIGETIDASANPETSSVLSTDTIIRYMDATEPIATGTLPSESQKASVAPTTVQSSTEKPSPTVPATERAVTPTEAPKETQPPKPTSPPPTDPPATQETTGIFPDGMPYISAAAAFPSSLLSHDDVVCCAIYDHGKLVSQGEASVYIMKNGSVFAEYDTGIEAERGKIYHYTFFAEQTSANVYEESSIFASGTITYE
ncbi:MAG: hypothetical protein IJV48_07295 [Ruminococcus sp.]|nr:hypothetical protein [Ruminococcus sp.]